MDNAERETQLRTTAMLKTAMGPEISAALNDPSVIEIMVNPDGQLWIERQGSGRSVSEKHMGASAAERVIRLVGTHIGQDVTKNTPIVSAELPGGGQRFEGLLPPVVKAPSFAIRKPATKIFTLEDYASAKIMSANQIIALRRAVTNSMNILIVGGTSSGKTTLANALLHEVAKLGQRVLILEDTRELQCAAPDCVAMRTQAGSVSLADLVRSTLRLRPDRIIIGEVRGAEALEMLKAWNTGHPGGIATIHANSASGGLDRLEQLIGEVSRRIPHNLIAEAIDLIVFISGRGGQRSVRAITEVQGHDGYEYDLVPFVSSKPKIITPNFSTKTGDPSC